ncbi:MAG: YggS family pyridoxal phosphate-dependent enzyme [Candidatus Eisenbacteria bacterium]
MKDTLHSLSDRLQEVRARIAAAERLAGRPAGSATLIGVVKTQADDVITAAVGLGLCDLGENRVQEAELHQQSVARDSAKWHMIGHLQRNKVGKALALFDFVHGIDDFELAGALSRRAAAEHRRLAVLIEVNVSGEESKFGADPLALPGLLERVMTLEGLDVRGLMTVGAPVETSELARPGFVRLRKLRDTAQRQLGLPLPELSMGMSGDYEVAVEEGSTLVRVGTAIFGSREP